MTDGQITIRSTFSRLTSSWRGGLRLTLSDCLGATSGHTIQIFMGRLLVKVATRGMGLLQRLGLRRASPPPNINSLLQMISRRAERLDAHQQAETFVSLGGIEHTLLNFDNRVIFGRRGTGKTHVMSFVADSAKKKGQMALSLDLRTIGSNSYIYADESFSLQERATRLLRDFLSALHDALLDHVTAPRSGYDVNRLSPLIDRLGNAVREVVVGESVERKQIDQGSSESTVGGQGTARASALLGSLELKGKGEYKRTGGTSTEIVERGHPRLSINIGEVAALYPSWLTELVREFGF